jgi:hypothetical protein
VWHGAALQGARQPAPVQRVTQRALHVTVTTARWQRSGYHVCVCDYDWIAMVTATYGKDLSRDQAFFKAQACTRN